MRRILQIIFLILLTSPLHQAKAQFTIEKRNAVPIDRNAPAEYELISLKKHGLLLISVIQPWKYSNEKEFQLSYMDTTFNLIKADKYLLPFIFAQDRLTYYDEVNLMFFFAQDEASKEVSIFRLNIFSGEQKLKKFKLPVKMDVEEFHAVGDQVYMMGSVGVKHVVVSYSFVDESPKVIPSFYEDNEKMAHVQPDVGNQQIYFMMKNNLNKRCNLLVKPYSNLIGTLARMEVKEKGQRTPLNARLLPVDNKEKIILGTYSLRCTKNPQGLFIANFSGQQLLDIRYRKFIDFSNFFNYHKDKKAQRMREKIEKKESKGKEYTLNRKFIMQNDLYKINDEYVMVIEGYYTSYQGGNNLSSLSRPLPSYNYNFYNSYGFNGLHRPRSPARSSTTSLNQYNYALFCGFDKDGRLKWDNVMKIDRVEQMNLSEVVEVGNLGDSLIVAYQKDEDIYSKMIHRYKEVKKETKQELKDLYEGLEVNEFDWHKLVHWYDDVYILYGEQRLKTKVVVENQVGKLVFHITKMRYYPQPDIEEEKVVSKKEQ